MRNYIILLAVILIVAVKIAAWGYDVVSSSITHQQELAITILEDR